MSNNVIEVVNQMGIDEGMPDVIVFGNIFKESNLDDMYRDVNSKGDSICVSNKSWIMSKNGDQEDQKNIVYDDAVDDNKIDNLNKEDVLHLHDGLADNNNNDDNNNNYIKHNGVINQQDGQEIHFSGADNNQQAQEENFGEMNELDPNNMNKGEEHDKAGNKVQNQGGNSNNHAEISNDEGSSYFMILTTIIMM